MVNNQALLGIFFSMKFKHYFILLLLFSCSEDTGDSPSEQITIQSIRIGTTALKEERVITSIGIDTPISIFFDRAVNESSLSTSIGLSENETAIPLTFTLSTDQKSVVVGHSNLKPLTQYKLTIGNSLAGAKGEIFKELEFIFQTENGRLVMDEIKLNDIDFSGVTELQNIPLTFTINIKFSEPLNTSTNFATSIKLQKQGLDQPLTFALNSDNTTLTVSTASTLEDLQKHSFSILSTLQSTQGFTFGGFTRQFYTQLDSTFKFPEISDVALLTKVQEQTFKYFWDFGHPVSGLARERNTSGDLVTIGGSGFGVMAILVGIERGFISRQEGIDRLETIVNFLESADRFHGVWPHWMNGATGNTIPFSSDDDGADLVESAFMIQGLLAVRQYLNAGNAQELTIKNKITTLWEEVEWDWFRQGGQSVLYWHWSPNFAWQKNHAIRGWNESLIIYTLAASSPTHPINKATYDAGWASNGGIKNEKSFYDITLPLGEDRGGPLFFAHYSFLGLDPRNLQDQYANYMTQNTNHTLINRAYCLQNPKNYVGYSTGAWGLTASDNKGGYSAHSPNNDRGVITPTAAISSIPYTPDESLDAIQHFYYLLGDRVWGEYGFYDAFNSTENWYANSYLAIDQGPIIIMIENYRSGLLWNLFMENSEIQTGLSTLGFTY